MKRVFGTVELVFDGLYLAAGVCIGVFLLITGGGSFARILAGIMALVLAGGDAFHLVPRMRLIRTGDEKRLRAALGRGKKITSLTMTLFYLLLWMVSLQVIGVMPGTTRSLALYALVLVRILLCLLPQNRWQDSHPPVSWGILRNIPFLLLGAMVAVRFYLYRSAAGGLYWMWLAIILSFACYLPVVLLANKYPKIGMLMLPKTCAYLWILAMCLTL